MRGHKMFKKSVIMLACAASFSTAAFAGNIEPVRTEAAIILPAEIEPTGSLTSSSAGAAIPIGIGLLLVAAIAASGGS